MQMAVLNCIVQNFQIDHTFVTYYEGQNNNYASIRPGRKAGNPTVSSFGRGQIQAMTGLVFFKDTQINFVSFWRHFIMSQENLKPEKSKTG